MNGKFFYLCTLLTLFFISIFLFITLIMITEHPKNSQYTYYQYQRTPQLTFELNTKIISLSKQLQTWRNNYKNLQQDYRDLEIKYAELKEQLSQKNGEKSSSNYQQNEEELFQKRKRLSSEDSEVSMIINKVDIRPPDSQNFIQIRDHFLDQITYLKEQLYLLQGKLNEKDDLFNEIAKTLNEKDHLVKQFEQKVKFLSEEMEKKSKISNNMENIFKIKEELEQQKRKNEQLSQMLRKSEDWSRKIQSQYEEIRKSIVLQPIINTNLAQSLKLSNIEKVKTETDYSWRPRNKSKMQLKQDNEEVNKLKNLLAQKKSKYKSHIQKLNGQMNELNKKINLMNSFIEKQQFFIENFIHKNREQSWFFQGKHI